MSARTLIPQFAFAVMAVLGAYNTYTLFRDQPIDWGNVPQTALILGLGALSGLITLVPAVMVVKTPSLLGA